MILKKFNYVFNSEHLLVSRCPGKGAHNFWTGDQASTRCWERAWTMCTLHSCRKRLQFQFGTNMCRWKIYVSMTKCSVEMENKKYKYHQKKEQIPKGCRIFVSGGVVPRFWCQSKECDRFPDSTTTQRDHRTSRILERAEQIQIQTYL